GPLRLAAGLAGRRLGHGLLRRGRSDLAGDRASGRRQAEIRLQQPATGDDTPAGRAAVEEPLAGGARLSTDERRVGPGSFRGPRSSSRGGVGGIQQVVSAVSSPAPATGPSGLASAPRSTR